MVACAPFVVPQNVASGGETPNLKHFFSTAITQRPNTFFIPNASHFRKCDAVTVSWANGWANVKGYLKVMARPATFLQLGFVVCPIRAEGLLSILIDLQTSHAVLSVIEICWQYSSD